MGQVQVSSTPTPSPTVEPLIQASVILMHGEPTVFLRMPLEQARRLHTLVGSVGGPCGPEDSNKGCTVHLESLKPGLRHHLLTPLYQALGEAGVMGEWDESPF